MRKILLKRRSLTDALRRVISPLEISHPTALGPALEEYVVLLHLPRELFHTAFVRALNEYTQQVTIARR